MNKNKIKRIINSLVLSIFVLILIVTLPYIGINDSEELHNIFSVFMGDKPEFQGIIEVWNIDSFDGGSASKSSFLNSTSKEFEKKYKGVYVMVKDLTEYECINLLQKGYKPDLFSCSYGVASEIKDYITPLSDISDIKVNENLINAGKIGNDAYGIAWCYGYYSLISSYNHLNNANFFKKFNIKEDEKFKLSDYACLVGYEKKKNNKIVSSITYGNNKYLMPKYALTSYNNKGLNENIDFAIDENVKTNTCYDAYTKFLTGSSVMLLGTQRDVVRVNGRVESGKLDGVIMENITTFTDLIQYIFLSNGDNYDRLKVSENFIKMLVSSEIQQKLINIKMNPTIAILDDNQNIMSDITLDFNSICKINNVFISKSEIFNSQK